MCSRDFINVISNCYYNHIVYYFISRGVLRRSESIEEGGEVLWDQALCLLLAWIVIFLCLIKGVKSSGKV